MKRNPIATYRSVLNRFVQLYKHVLGLIIGAFVVSVRNLSPIKRKGLRSAGRRVIAFFLKFTIKKELRNQPFEVQLRRRLEMLGPTYVKLGQIMAIREDILPKNITGELKQLLDHLPEVPFESIRAIIERSLNNSLKNLFLYVDPQPIGSASIGQIHHATTQDGIPVVLKVIKPGIRETIMSDLKLMQILGTFLEWIIPRFQPKVIIAEFSRYTEREIDLIYEADHAELFAANFANSPEIVFPKIYRQFSTRDVLCMSFMNGIKPNDPEILSLSAADQRQIIDIGTFSIIKMLFEDGFFHADLHAGNLIILPGPKIAFIDLGMVGRFDEKVMRIMLYYFYALVNGDVERSAKHLLAMAKVGRGGDPAGFERSVTDLLRRFLLQAHHGNFSLAQLILESLRLSSRYRIFFPVEMTLMVKALVTFEGVGQFLSPNLDVPALSRKHIQRIYSQHFSIDNLYKHFMRGAPELLDFMVRLPKLASDSSRSLEDFLNDGNTQENPLSGIKSALIAGACVVGMVISLVQDGHPALSVSLLIAAILFFIFGK